MTAMTRLTVVIPCYNHGHFLAEAIQSVLDQDYDDLETIVINDGSTDKTAEVAASYAPRVIHIYQPNQGVAAARNTGLDAATGEYVYILDADDVLLPGALRRLAVYLDAHPDHGAVYADGYYCDAQLKPLGRMSVGQPGGVSGYILPQVVMNAFLYSTLMRRTAIREHGLRFDPSIGISDDWDFMIQLAARVTFGYVDAVNYYYRLHGANSTILTWQRRQESLIRNRRKTMESWFFDGLPDDVRTRFLRDFLVFHLRGRPEEQAELLAGPKVAALSRGGRAAVYRSYGLRSLESGEYAAARRCLERSLAEQPRVVTRVLGLATYVPPAVIGPVLRTSRHVLGRKWAHPMDDFLAHEEAEN